MEKRTYLPFLDSHFGLAKSSTRPPATYFHKLESDFTLAPNLKGSDNTGLQK
jgi:hypothetical protein